MITQENITLSQRLKAPTPKFFRTLRTVFLSMAAIAGMIVAAPVGFPAIVVTVAGYVVAAGTVAGAVGMLPVDFKALNEKQELR